MPDHYQHVPMADLVFCGGPLNGHLDRAMPMSQFSGVYRIPLATSNVFEEMSLRRVADPIVPVGTYTEASRVQEPCGCYLVTMKFREEES